MYSIEKLLEMITSKRSSVRYEACEWLRIRQESSDEIIYALQKAAYDTDPEVIARAALALQSDVHHQQMMHMGLIQPDEHELETPGVQPGAVGEVQGKDLVMNDRANMLKEIRSWGYWCLFLGVLHIALYGRLSPQWGILLILVGLASFYFRNASIFIIYAVTMLWAAFSNFLGFTIIWVIFAIVQVYFSIRIFMSYQRYSKVETEYLGSKIDQISIDPSIQRASTLFPWVGSFLGCISTLGLVAVILIALLLGIKTGNTSSTPGYLNFSFSFLVNIGVLGFAVGLASLLAKYRLKALALTGVVAGAVTLLLALGLRLLSLLS